MFSLFTCIIHHKPLRHPFSLCYSPTLNMKIKNITTTLFILFRASLAWGEVNTPALKEQVALYRQQAREAKSSEEKGSALVYAAVALWKDQELEESIITFLSVFELAFPPYKGQPSKEEIDLYNEALKSYFGHNTGSEMQETAQHLLSTYLPAVEAHPDYYQLNFMVAAAYANLGKYDDFFRRFYESYRRYPAAYMSYRTQAILHIKLYERARTEASRELERSRIAALINKALQVNGEDPSLYRMMIAFAPASEKARVTRDALQTILRCNIMIPRQDILFYVQHALNAHEKLLAERFIAKAKSWYQYSRVVNHAEELLRKEK